MAEPANVYVCVGGGGGGGETNYVFGQEVVVQDSVCPNRKVSHPTIRAQCHTHAPPHTYSVASMPWRAFARVMTLRWAQAQVNEGIGAQGEMFIMFHSQKFHELCLDLGAAPAMPSPW
jgi:hypothetical protein